MGAGTKCLVERSGTPSNHEDVLTATRPLENVAAPVSYWGASLCGVLESVEMSQPVGDPVPTGER